MGRGRISKKSTAAPVLRRRLALSGAAVALLGLALPVTASLVTAGGAAGSLPTTCAATADVWQGTGTADWGTAADWSQGVVPTSASDACLPAGNYTVTVTGPNDEAATVEVLAGATLLVEGSVIPGYSEVSATLTASGTITNTGTIQLTEQAGNEGGSANLVDPSGTITNAGTISTTSAPADNGAARVINAALDNQGTLSVAAPTTFTDQAAAVTNENGASITTALGAVLSFGQSGAPGPNVTLAGGSVSNVGTIVQWGGAFAHTSGTATGNPLQLNGVALDPSLGGGTGTGSAAFQLFGPGNTLTGNVAANDTVSVDGFTIPGYSNVTGQLTASGPVTNAGAIILTEGVGTNGGIDGAGASFVDTAGTVTNTGTISTVPAPSDDGWGRTFEAALDNQGNVEIDSPTTFTLGSSTVTDAPGGNITTGVGETLSIGQSGVSGPSVDLAGGSITNQGTLIQYGGSFTHAAGSTTGNPVQLEGVALDPSLGAGTGTGAGSFVLFGSNALTGNVAATDTVSVDGFTIPGYSNVTGQLTASGPVTNAGTIILTEGVGAPGGIDGAGAVLADPSGTITNTGTISTVVAANDDGWGRGINASLVNEGNLNFAQTLNFGLSGGTVVQQNGSTILDAAVDASTEGGITVNGGVVSGTGTLTGPLVNTGGTVAPGLGATVGTLSLEGNYSQGASGVLQAAVDGTSSGAYAQLSVTGNANLGGTLAVEPSTGYAATAANGDSIPVFAYGAGRTGSFSQAGVAPQNTVAPSISGTVQVGKTLTCSQGSFTDSPTTYAYQWNRNGAAIASATSNQYTVTLGDSGTSLTCSVTASGGAPLNGGLGFSAVNDDPARTVDAVVGNGFISLPAQATSEAVDVLAGPVATGNPQVTGTPQVGQTLSCSEGTWANDPTQFGYVWNRDGVAIANTGAGTYKVVPGDVGHGLSCTVTASNGEGTASATSQAISVPLGPVPTGNPLITGTAQVGQTVGCSQGTWDNGPTQFAYVWNLDGVPISNATTSSYPVASGEAGKQLSCTVTASNADGLASATSTPVTVSAGTVTITTASTLPRAVGANAYSLALTACGGDLPSCESWSTSSNSMVDADGNPVLQADSFSFAQASGTLPPGLSLTPGGLLSGTPTQTGTYSFAVTAADPLGDGSAAAPLSLTVVAGMSVTTADGSYHEGGPITAGSVTVSPDGAGPIDSVVTTTGGDDHATVAGTATDNQIGIQVTDAGGLCSTDLDIAGASGTVLSAPGVATSGCDTTSSASTTAQIIPSSTTSTPAALAGDLTTSSRTTPSASTVPAVPAVATASAPSLLAATVPASSGSLLTGTANSFVLNIGVDNSTGEFVVSVTGGSYVSDLNGANAPAGLLMSAVTGTSGGIPDTLPITPLVSFVDSQDTSLPTTGVPMGGSGGLTLADFGFGTGTTEQQAVPSFSSGPSGAGFLTLGALAGLQGSTATLTPAQEVALLAALASDGFPGLPYPAGTSASPIVLPIGAAQSIFETSPPTFEAGNSGYIPPIAPVGSPIKQTLPITVTPPPPPAAAASATVTRLGPAAFNETITDPRPAVASAPFSPAGTTYTIEVVTDS